MFELHDSRVAAVRLASGDGVIEFSHFVVHHDVAPGHSDVWSYKAGLELRAIESFAIEGVVPPEGGLVDGEVLCDSHNDPRLLWLLAGVGAVEVKFVFASGAKMTVRARAARLQLHEALEKVDEFTEG